LFEGREDDVEVVGAHGLAVAPGCVRRLLDELDRDLGEPEPEGDGDAVVAVEVAVAAVEPHPQRDSDAGGGDALGQAVEVGGRVDDVGGRRYDLAVHGPVPGDHLGGEPDDEPGLAAQMPVPGSRRHAGDCNGERPVGLAPDNRRSLVANVRDP
jgi:hypothetical protein